MEFTERRVYKRHIKGYWVDGRLPTTSTNKGYKRVSRGIETACAIVKEKKEDNSNAF